MYKTLHDKQTYTQKPEPGLGIVKNIEYLYADFNRQNFPADNKKVKNVRSWLDLLRDNTPRLEEYYLEGYAEYAKAAEAEAKKSSLENFPDYNADVERLKTMYKTYKDPDSVFRNPEEAVEVIPKFNDEYAFFKNLPEKYEVLIKAQKAGSLITWIQTNEKYLDSFRQYQDKYAAELPDKIESALSAAIDMARKAEAEKNRRFLKAASGNIWKMQALF